MPISNSFQHFWPTALSSAMPTAVSSSSVWPEPVHVASIPPVRKAWRQCDCRCGVDADACPAPGTVVSPMTALFRNVGLCDLTRLLILLCLMCSNSSKRNKQTNGSKGHRNERDAAMLVTSMAASALCSLEYSLHKLCVAKEQCASWWLFPRVR